MYIIEGKKVALFVKGMNKKTFLLNLSTFPRFGKKSSEIVIIY